MKKLNNKGLTSIELVITFSITLVLAVSLFNSVLNYSQKMDIEDNKLRLYTYKNTLTRTIQTEIIKKEILSVSPVTSSTDSTGLTTTTVTLNYKDNTTGTIIINMKDIENLLVTDPNNTVYLSESNNSVFEVLYSNSDNTIKEAFILPNIGQYKYENTEKLLPTLFVDYVNISTENNIFTLYIKYRHPDLNDYFTTNITAPINH